MKVKSSSSSTTPIAQENNSDMMSICDTIRELILEPCWKSVFSDPTLTYTTNDGHHEFQYYTIPKWILSQAGRELGFDNFCVALYAIMRDRNNKSLKNAAKYTDKAGRIYFIDTIGNMAEELGICKSTIAETIAKMENIGILTVDRRKDKYNFDIASVYYLHHAAYSSSKKDLPAADRYPYYTSNDASSILPEEGFYTLPKVLVKVISQTSYRNKHMLISLAMLYWEEGSRWTFFKIDDQQQLTEEESAGRLEKLNNEIRWMEMPMSKIAESLGCNTRTASNLLKQMEDMHLVARKKRGHCYRWAHCFVPLFFLKWKQNIDSVLSILAKFFDVAEDKIRPILSMVHGTQANADMQVTGCEHTNQTDADMKVADTCNHPVNKLQLINAFEEQASCSGNCIKTEMDWRAEARAILHEEDAEDLIYRDSADEATLEERLNLLNECVELVSSDLREFHTSKKKSIKVNGKYMTLEQMVSHYRKITGAILFVAIKKVHANKAGIRNLTTYLRSVLCKAKQQHYREAYIVSQTILA